MDNKFEVTFLGTNGSCAYNNGNRAKYGSNTPCVAVLVGEQTLIFDSGSGICGFRDLKSYHKEQIHLFFSHYHVDHIDGLLFFSELFDPQKQIIMYGSGDNNTDLQEVVNNFLSTPLHPVGLAAFGAKLHFQAFRTGTAVLLPGGIKVHTYGLSHPGGSVGYRVEYEGKVFCYCTDVELADHLNDGGLLEFTRNADLLVLDSSFEDGAIIAGWGHSSWRECAEWAARVNAKRLALYHYGFDFCDDEIDAMQKKAQNIFPRTFASADRKRVEL